MTEQTVPDIPALEDAFRRVDVRMRDLPVYNPALQVVAAARAALESLMTQHGVPAPAVASAPAMAEESVPLSERSLTRRNFLRGRLFGS